MTVILQQISLQRQGSAIDQIYCMNCESFFHTSNYLESDDQLKGDADFLANQTDPHYSDILAMLQSASDTHSIFEVGAGTGALIAQLTAAGFQAEGVDPNRHAVQIARDRGASIAVGHFQALERPVDGILAIDVLEHVEDPRAMTMDVVGSLRPGGLFILRVPEVTRNEWKWLKGADHDRGFMEADPFRDNSVHITHFSPTGLGLMCNGLGFADAGVIDGGFRVYRLEG